MFENYLGMLKRMIRTPHKPLSQVCKRLEEQKDNTVFLKDSSSEFLVVYEKGGIVIKAIKYNNMYIAVRPDKESFILLPNKKIMAVRKIIQHENNEIQIFGSIFQNQENIFQSPIATSILSMYKVKDLSTFQFSANIHDVVTKCIAFPFVDGSNYRGAVGLLHINY